MSTATMVVLFPYLALPERVSIGGWEIIPRGQLTPEDTASLRHFELVPNYLALYRLPGGDGSLVPFGCFAKPRQLRIGDPFEPVLLRSLRLAVIAAVVDTNPSLDSADLNAGHYGSTSDNAHICMHPYNEDGLVTAQYGSLAKTQVFGLQAKGQPGIEPPTRLHLPTFGCRVDPSYAHGLYSILSREDDLARRLATTIEWLDFFWRNTDDILQDLRIVALRTAFEWLLHAGRGVDPSSEAIARLLRDGSSKVTRTWTYKGKAHTKQLSDLQWWFVNFVFRRNDIIHGTPLTAADYQHEGRAHVAVADEMLRRALRQTVADNGFPEVAIPLSGVDLILSITPREPRGARAARRA